MWFYTTSPSAPQATLPPGAAPGRARRRPGVRANDDFHRGLSPEAIGHHSCCLGQDAALTGAPGSGRMHRCLGLLGFLFAKSGIQLILCDSRRRVAALIKILFFGAITHHAGMGNIRLLTGILWNRRFIHHIRYSGAGAPPSTPACSMWFRASAKNRPGRHFAARSDPSKQSENDNDDQDDPQ